jgi:hypothetical protein
MNFPSVLFTQQQVACIRNYKFAYAMKNAGYRIGLFTDGKTPGEFYTQSADKSFLNDELAYDEIIRAGGVDELLSASVNYDLIMCHNEPDHFTMLALGTGKPVIHNAHDIISQTNRKRSSATMNTEKALERLAMLRSDGVIFASEGMELLLKELYPEMKAPGIAIFSYPLRDHIPSTDQLKPKKSLRDGKCHLVYSGSYSLIENAERNFHNFLYELTSKNENIEVHIYTPYFNETLANTYSQTRDQGLHYEGYINPVSLLSELSQYDFGIIMRAGNDIGRNYNSMMPNKLFEYHAAGLPIYVCDKVQSMEKFAMEHPDLAKVYTSIDDLQNMLAADKDWKIHQRDTFVFENQIPILNEYILNVIRFYVFQKSAATFSIS